MNFNITGHHVEVTKPLKEYVSEKLNKIEGHFDKITSVNVVLTVEKLEQKAEATLHVKGNDIHAGATKEDMYAAIDEMTDKLDRQVRRYKTKLKDHRK